MSDLHPPRRRILVVYNPAAGPFRLRRLGAVTEALKSAAEVEFVETRQPGHAIGIAQDLDPDRFDVIAAAGGDGTVNEIINGLGTKNVAVGVIPLGTANVLAHEIGLSGRAAAIAAALAHGPIRPIRVGRVNGRRFIMMAGAGFDADVVAGVTSALKRRLGPFAYVLQGAKRAFDRRLPPFEILIDGQAFQASSMVACNGRLYGGPFVAAPASALSDDRLHVVLLKGTGPLAAAKYGAALVLGMLPRLADVEIVPGRRIEVRGGAGRPLQADGDVVAHLPATIEVDPDPIRLVYPA